MIMHWDMYVYMYVLRSIAHICIHIYILLIMKQYSATKASLVHCIQQHGLDLGELSEYNHKGKFMMIKSSFMEKLYISL